ncbi:MAG: hypothetical protein AAGC55_26445, partial [Myxococcota bacterium]
MTAVATFMKHPPFNSKFVELARVAAGRCDALDARLAGGQVVEMSGKMPRIVGAGEGIRTPDVDLGKVADR